jgi:DNA-directed RNA polymerase subunit F
LREQVRYALGERPVNLSQREKIAVNDAIGEDFETARKELLEAVKEFNDMCKNAPENTENLTETKSQLFQAIDNIIIKLICAEIPEISPEKRQELTLVFQDLKHLTVFVP